MFTQAHCWRQLVKQIELKTADVGSFMNVKYYMGTPFSLVNCLNYMVVVTKVAERLFINQEDPGSNPIIGNF